MGERFRFMHCSKGKDFGLGLGISRILIEWSLMDIEG